MSRLDVPAWSAHTYGWWILFDIPDHEMDVIEMLPGWTLAGWLRAHGYIDPHVPGRFHE